ncbi:MAG: class I SAM-dependent methyltransferase [Candidatus Bathyarchaeia archaeon]|nr:class I SAM-dependent methyltransferase [Candidatus Bathyarchaeia archaeon]
MAEPSEVGTEKSLSEETHWEKAAKTRMGKYLTQMETDFILKSITPSQTCTVMDVGTEAGKFSSVASEKNATVIGLDLDSYGLKRLKLKTKNVGVIQADARKIPVKASTFDVILMIEVLDYIPDLDEAFMECHRTLKSDAIFICSFGNRRSLKSQLRKLIGKSYMHSYNRVIQSLSRTGFSVVRKVGYGWLPFGRTSESRLIPFLALLEKLFALRRIPSVSPWVIVHSIKSEKTL